MEMPTHYVRGYLHRETCTGELRSTVYQVEEDFKLVDGDGDMHPVSAGSVLVVVDIPYSEYATGEKLLDAAERYYHGLWGHRARAELTRTTFDVRTTKGGRRPDAEDVPF